MKKKFGLQHRRESIWVEKGILVGLYRPFRDEIIEEFIFLPIFGS